MILTVQDDRFDKKQFFVTIPTVSGLALSFAFSRQWKQLWILVRLLNLWLSELIVKGTGLGEITRFLGSESNYLHQKYRSIWCNTQS